MKTFGPSALGRSADNATRKWWLMETSLLERPEPLASLPFEPTKVIAIATFASLVIRRGPKAQPFA